MSHLVSCVAWYTREIYYVFIEPWLAKLGLVYFGFGDASYGREAIPNSNIERELIYEAPGVKVTRRRVFFSYNEPILDLKMQGQGLRLPFSYLGKPVTAWVNYYVWERPDEVARAKRTFEAC